MGIYLHAVFQYLIDVADCEIVALVVHPKLYQTKFQKVKKSLKKGRGAYTLILIFQSVFQTIRGLIAKSKHAIHFTNIAGAEQIPLIRLNDLYSTESLKIIKELHADAGVLFGYHRIVKPVFINIFPTGVLSYHYGDMRKYRGQTAGFWELYYGEKELGITVQLISEEIDRGRPVFEISIPIQPDDLMRDLDKKVEIQTPSMMAMAIKRLMTESSQPSPLNSYGKLYTVPTIGQWFIYQSYMFRRRLLKLLFKKKQISHSIQ